jgi:hypothetical protein
VNSVTFLQRALIILFALLFAAEAVLALQWRLVQDAPLLHYVAWLANEHDYVVYRDIFETSMPGTFLVHMFIGRLFGYGDLAFRLVDLAWLASLMTVSWLLIRRINPVVAWASTLGFAITYIAYGPGMTMQRDYLGLLPIAGAMLIAAGSRYSTGTRAALVGGLFATAVTLKPHLGLGLPFVLIYMTVRENEDWKNDYSAAFKSLIRIGLLASTGFLPVLLLPVLWLWLTGGLETFWEMATRYLPLHVDMTGSIETVTPEKYFDYTVRKYIHGIRFYVPPAILGIFFALRFGGLERDQRRLVYLFACLIFVYSIYTVIGGKYWLYHWIPFRYMVMVCTALVLLPLVQLNRRKLIESGCVVLFAAMLFIWVSLWGYDKQTLRFPASFVHQVSGLPPPSPRDGMVDEIADFLIAAELGPDEKVQPLDWVAGAVHAMLIAEALPATPYVYDYYFYHYISNPYIQKIRQEYIAALQTDLPRYMIDITFKVRPTGLDTTDTFPELEAIIESQYRVAQKGTNYRILERIAD